MSVLCIISYFISFPEMQYVVPGDAICRTRRCNICRTRRCNMSYQEMQYVVPGGKICRTRRCNMSYREMQYVVPGDAISRTLKISDVHLVTTLTYTPAVQHTQWGELIWPELWARDGFSYFRIFRGGRGWINIWGVLLLALARAWWQRPERPRKKFNKICFLGLHGEIWDHNKYETIKSKYM